LSFDMSLFNRPSSELANIVLAGIGTYDISGGSLNKGPIGNFFSGISRTIDEGIATTFDAHVIAGYRFLMNHYDKGDKIYMFGFSRGAYTARFLARMVNTVGLLSKGNDEMVPFAYQLYQRYETDLPRGSKEQPLLNDPSDRREVAFEVKMFSDTFCRKEDDQNVKIYFLGIFDCVNSVAVLETSPKTPIPVLGTATHVRHAVAVDEFRVKFKPALLAQDVRAKQQQAQVKQHAPDHSCEAEIETIKEVWFPGNHGDVGGGWPAEQQPIAEPPKGPFGYIKKWFSKARSLFVIPPPPGASRDVSKDPFQLSDIALDWMIRELELVGKKEPKWAVSFSERMYGFKNKIRNVNSTEYKQAHASIIHNTMKLGGGSTFFKVLFWNFMEYLPFIKRFELEENKWTSRWWPLNRGSARDIPRDAVLHNSLIQRLASKDLHYSPRNNNGIENKKNTPDCLLGGSSKFRKQEESEFLVGEKAMEDHVHETYRFANSL
jgi:hypothetical protein